MYLGSFSKLLLPSVRISYMVLPPSLLTRYAPRARAYNQTSSKVEQLALADYIREGQLERHLRRMRKLYLLKSRQLQESIRKELGKTVPMALLETALAVVIQVPGARDIAERAAQKGIRVFPVGKTCFGWALRGFLGPDFPGNGRTGPGDGGQTLNAVCGYSKIENK